LKSLKIGKYNFWLKTIKGHGIILQPQNQNINPSKIAQQIQQNLNQKKLKVVKNVIATSEEIFLETDKSKKAIKEIASLKIKTHSPCKWKIPVLFNEDNDWKEIIKSTGLSRKAYIKKILSLEICVEMMGFLPGFVYAGGLPKKMQITRKEKPVYNSTSNVLAVGGPYVGIYSLPSPSGWYVIGRIPIGILNLNDGNPLPFKIEDQLELEAISESKFKKIVSKNLNLITYNA